MFQWILLIQKMQKAKEIKNMADPFLLLRTMYDCAIGIDIRWTKTNGGFDLKREIYDQMMLVLQPSVEITNYDQVLKRIIDIQYFF